MHPREFFNMDPFTLMRRMQDDMDRAFGQSRAWGEAESGNWSPAIEVSERDGKLRVTAELPGLKQDDVKVEATEEGRRARRSNRLPRTSTMASWK